MEEINNIEVGPCTESNYLKPFRVHYSQVSLCLGSGAAGGCGLTLADPLTDNDANKQ